MAGGEAITALAAKQQAAMQKWEEMEKKVKKMEAEQAEAKKKARKSAIKEESDKYLNKSIKRGVKVQMESLDFITDLEEVWADLAKAAEGAGEGGGEGTVITADNVKQSNDALDQMTTIITKFRLHTQWELDMQIAAGSSTMGWGTVTQWELKKKREEGESVWSMTPEDMRKIEQEKLTYDRQLRLAGRGGGAAGFDGKRDYERAFGDIWMDGQEPYAGAPRGRGGRGRGAPDYQRGGGAPRRGGVRCYGCGGNHFHKDCRVQAGS